MKLTYGAFAAAVLALGGCGEPAPPADPIPAPDVATADSHADANVGARDGLRVRMTSGPREGLFDGPVPSLDLEGDGATERLEAWPGLGDVPWLGALAPLAAEAQGRASLAGAFFLPLEGLGAPARDALAERGPVTVPRDAPIADSGLALFALRPDGTPERLPLSFAFLPDGGPHGAPDLLVVKPPAGLPLPPGAPVAVAVTSDFASRLGLDPGRSPALAALLAAPSPDHGDAADAELARGVIAALERAGGIPAGELIGLAVARTADPAGTFRDTATRALAAHAAALGPPTLVEQHPSFCVFRIDATFPDFQAGAPPFEAPGDGAWQLDAEGTPILARRATSRVFLTIPVAVRPGATLPVAVFVRTGGGGDRPLIDRGVRAEAGGPPVPPTGEGPARHLAAAGWAGATWDGPHGGARNPGGADEQFLMFNVLNPPAAIGNVLQTALEASLLRRALDRLELPACEGEGVISFDTAEAAIIGHSMGAWVAPLAMSLDPAFTAAVLSGAGGGWIENVVYKERPLHVRPLAELILGYTALDRPLGPFDPALTLLQWAGEIADPQVHGALAMTPPRDVLVVQGVVDTYILPPIAAALQVAMGLDLAGPALDAADPRLTGYVPLAESLALAGLRALPFPVQANRDGRTAVVVQLAEDGVEDGHEVFFQRPEAHRLLTCFFADLKAGRAPRVDPRDARSCGDSR